MPAFLTTSGRTGLKSFVQRLALPLMQLTALQLTTLLTTIEIAATIAFAMSGLIEATRKKMDIVGVFSVTFVSAFAGEPCATS